MVYTRPLGLRGRSASPFMSRQDFRCTTREFTPGEETQQIHWTCFLRAGFRAGAISCTVHSTMVCTLHSVSSLLQ